MPNNSNLVLLDKERLLLRLSIVILGRFNLELLFTAIICLSCGFLLAKLRDRFFGVSVNESILQQGKKLKEYEEKTRLIVETSLDAIIMMDRYGRITEWNKQAESIFGWTRLEAIGRVLSNTIIPEKYREAHERGVKHYFETGEGPVLNKRIEITALHKAGHEFQVELAITPQVMDGEAFFSAFLRDITPRKQAEQELIRAKELAETAAKAKSAFLANMSHEIRTPINGILGMMQIMLNMKLENQQYDLIRMSMESAQSLLQIINDILDFSKIEAGKLNIELIETDLQNIISEVLSSTALKAYEKNLEVLCEIDPNLPSQVLVDPVRIRQILINIVNNATKFTESGEIILRVQLLNFSTDYSTIQISISDTGIGIPQARLESIFQPFTQVDESTTRKYGGTGLGLSICKELIALMGGKITVSSVLGVGTTFDIFLTFANKVKNENKTESVDLGNLIKGSNILLIDNRTKVASHIDGILSNFGCEVIAANTLEQGVEILLERIESAAIDIMLIDLSAIERFKLSILDPILSDHKFKNLRIVSLIALNQAPDLKSFQEKGLQYFVYKPFLPRQLLEVLANSVALQLPNSSYPKEKHILRKDEIFPHSQKPKTILVTDDVNMNRTVAKLMLEQWGHKVILADSGRKTIELLQQTGYFDRNDESAPFDLILMDIQMPGLDGVQTTRQIRSSEGISGKGPIPVVALTANALEGDKEYFLAQGMDYYLPKPINAKELYQLLESDNIHSFCPSTNILDNGNSSISLDDSSINFDELNSRFGGNNEAVIEVINACLEELPMLLGNLTQAINANDINAVKKSAHALKGSVANLAAHGAAKQAGYLEQHCIERSLKDIQQDFEMLYQNIETVISSAQAYRKSKSFQ